MPLETGGRTPHLDQDLLSDLFSLRCITQHPRDHMEDARCHQFVEMLECPLFALRDRNK